MPRLQVTNTELPRVLLEAVRRTPRSIKALSSDLGIGYGRTKVALEDLVEQKILAVVEEVLGNRKPNRVFYEKGSEPGAHKKASSSETLQAFQAHAAYLISKGVRY